MDGYLLTLSQNDWKHVEMNQTGCGQFLNGMTSDFTEMALVLSSWQGSGNDMNFMQNGVCPQSATCQADSFM